MQDVNKRRERAIIRQTESFVVAALGEVVQAVFALLLLHQRARPRAQSTRPVEFYALRPREDNGLPGVNRRRAVGVAPEDVETRGRINGRDARARDPEEFFEQG